MAQQVVEARLNAGSTNKYTRIDGFHSMLGSVFHEFVHLHGCFFTTRSKLTQSMQYAKVLHTAWGPRCGPGVWACELWTFVAIFNAPSIIHATHGMATLWFGSALAIVQHI
jgi:hypothetical protein